MAKPRNNGADKVEKLKRIRIIQEYLVLGKNPKDIVTQVASAWGITPRMAQHYVNKAFDDFKTLSGQNIESLRGFHIQSRMKLLDWAMERNKTLALDVLQDMAKLQGLYVHKTDITSGGEKMNLVQVFLPDNGRDSDAEN
jgi:hypothetical protein